MLSNAMRAMTLQERVRDFNTLDGHSHTQLLGRAGSVAATAMPRAETATRAAKYGPGLSTSEPHNPLLPFFGPPLRPVDELVDDQALSTVEDLWGAYRGRSCYMAATLATSIIEEDSWLTQHICPWYATEELTVTTNSYEIDKVIPEFAPELAPTRFVGFTTAQSTAYLQRRSLGLHMEWEFWRTPAGRKAFLMKLKAIQQSIHVMIYYQCVDAFFRAESYYAQHDTGAGRARSPGERMELEKYYCAILQKDPNGLLLLDALADREAGTISVRFDTWILPSGLLGFVNQETQGKLDYGTSGPKAYSNFDKGDKVSTFRDKSVREVYEGEFSDSSGRIELMGRRKFIGDFFTVSSETVVDFSKYKSDWCSTMFLDMDSSNGRWAKVGLEQVIANCARFNENGDLDEAHIELINNLSMYQTWNYDPNDVDMFVVRSKSTDVHNRSDYVVADFFGQMTEKSLSDEYMRNMGKTVRAHVESKLTSEEIKAYEAGFRMRERLFNVDLTNPDACAFLWAAARSNPRQTGPWGSSCLPPNEVGCIDLPFFKKYAGLNNDDLYLHVKTGANSFSPVLKKEPVLRWAVETELANNGRTATITGLDTYFLASDMTDAEFTALARKPDCMVKGPAIPYGFGHWVGMRTIAQLGRAAHGDGRKGYSDEDIKVAVAYERVGLRIAGIYSSIFVGSNAHPEHMAFDPHACPYFYKTPSNARDDSVSTFFMNFVEPFPFSFYVKTPNANNPLGGTSFQPHPARQNRAETATGVRERMVAARDTYPAPVNATDYDIALQTILEHSTEAASVFIDRATTERFIADFPTYVGRTFKELMTKQAKPNPSSSLWAFMRTEIFQEAGVVGGKLGLQATTAEVALGFPAGRLHLFDRVVAAVQNRTHLNLTRMKIDDICAEAALDSNAGAPSLFSQQPTRRAHALGAPSTEDPSRVFYNAAARGSQAVVDPAVANFVCTRLAISGQSWRNYHAHHAAKADAERNAAIAAFPFRPMNPIHPTTYLDATTADLGVDRASTFEGFKYAAAERTHSSLHHITHALPQLRSGEVSSAPGPSGGSKRNRRTGTRDGDRFEFPFAGARYEGHDYQAEADTRPSGRGLYEFYYRQDLPSLEILKQIPVGSNLEFNEDSLRRFNDARYDSDEVFERIARQLLVITRITSKQLVAFVRKDILPPFEAVLERPFRLYTFQCAIVCKAGCGRTFYGHVDFQLGSRPDVKEIIGHFSMYSGTIITDVRCFRVFEDVHVSGYHGGEGTQFFSAPLTIDDIRESGKSIVVRMVPYGTSIHQSNDSAMDLTTYRGLGPHTLTGRWDARLVNGDYPMSKAERSKWTSVNAPSALYMCQRWDLMHALPNIPVSRAADARAEQGNFPLYPAMQRKYNPTKGDWSHIIVANDHFGENGSYEGCGLVRSGLAGMFKDMDYTKRAM